MTKTQSAALAYFEKASRERSIDPRVKEAITLFDSLCRKWQRMGFDFSFESAGYAPLIWFRKWHSEGCKGGVARFRMGLHTCLRWSMCKPVPRAARTVSGFTEDGSPHFRILRGGRPIYTKDEAKSICAGLNAVQKAEKGPFRYSYFTNKARDWQGLYKIRRVEFAVVFPATVSLDALDFEVLGYDEYGDLQGDFHDYRIAS
jgi:hypothetical protein